MKTDFCILLLALFPSDATAHTSGDEVKEVVEMLDELDEIEADMRAIGLHAADYEKLEVDEVMEEVLEKTDGVEGIEATAKAVDLYVVDEEAPNIEAKFIGCSTGMTLLKSYITFASIVLGAASGNPAAASAMALGATTIADLVGCSPDTSQKEIARLMEAIATQVYIEESYNAITKAAKSFYSSIKGAKFENYSLQQLNSVYTEVRGLLSDLHTVPRAGIVLMYELSILEVSLHLMMMGRYNPKDKDQLKNCVSQANRLQNTFENAEDFLNAARLLYGRDWSKYTSCHYKCVSKTTHNSACENTFCVQWVEGWSYGTCRSNQYPKFNSHGCVAKPSYCKFNHKCPQDQLLEVYDIAYKNSMAILNKDISEWMDQSQEIRTEWNKLKDVYYGILEWGTPKKKPDELSYLCGSLLKRKIVDQYELQAPSLCSAVSNGNAERRPTEEECLEVFHTLDKKNPGRNLSRQKTLLIISSGQSPPGCYVDESNLITWNDTGSEDEDRWMGRKYTQACVSWDYAQTGGK